jgi:hypothetical protein
MDANFQFMDEGVRQHQDNRRGLPQTKFNYPWLWPTHHSHAFTALMCLDRCCRTSGRPVPGQSSISWLGRALL